MRAPMSPRVGVLVIAILVVFLSLFTAIQGSVERREHGRLANGPTR